MAQSIRDIIQTTELLEAGDTVQFTDSEGTQHEGEITETELHDEHRDFTVNSTNGEPVLQVIYDIEGGPVTVRVALDNQETREITSIQKTN